jgi:hypothetical protein
VFGLGGRVDRRGIPLTRESVYKHETDDFSGRGLTDWMLRQFTETDGMLHPILVELKDDSHRWYELEIRRHYVNIYYRGGNLMEIRQPDPCYGRLTARFDKRYIAKYAGEGKWERKSPPTPDELAVHGRLEADDVLGSRVLTSREIVEKHAASFADRRAAMDANKKRWPKGERETQQAVALANNAADSEYLVCDVEYSFAHKHPHAKSDDEKNKTSFLDIVAAYRPEGASGDTPARLTLIELKYGASAIDGAAGLREHVEDIAQLMTEAGNFDAIGDELVRMMAHKHRLGLAPPPVHSFERGTDVDYVIAVAAHNPHSQVLRDALLGRHGLGEERLASPPGLRVRVAILRDDNVLRREDLIALEALTEGNVPPEIYTGTPVTRRRRKDEPQ